MKFHNAHAEIDVPDGQPLKQALSRTTHMAVGAHQDDLEIMALHGILQCFSSQDRRFTGIVCTDGSNSPRTGTYAHYTPEMMQVLRHEEQLNAARIGRYGAIIQLEYESAEIKDPGNEYPIEDLRKLFEICQPKIVYTHNPADKHDTHVAVTGRVLQAIREMPLDQRPARLYGCEVWRSLDWMPDEDKVLMDVSAHENLSNALLGIFDSQISGGKRYDLAVAGRQLANATFLEAHETDKLRRACTAMDLTPLIQNDDLDLSEYVVQFVQRMANDIVARLRKVNTLE